MQTCNNVSGNFRTPSPKVNGIRLHDDFQDTEDAEDNSSQHGVGDGSVGSDTETSKIEVADSTNKELVDNQDAVRANLLRKPATFKAVSVTKSFLAKAGTTSAPNGKAVNEKGNWDIQM